jgi:thiol:disulfide interchange protein
MINGHEDANPGPDVKSSTNPPGGGRLTLERPFSGAKHGGRLPRMKATRSLSLVTAAVTLALLATVPAAATSATSKSATATKPGAHSVVPFINDDLDRALADAKKTNRPIFVESWAPW